MEGMVSYVAVMCRQMYWYACVADLMLLSCVVFFSGCMLNVVCLFLMPS